LNYFCSHRYWSRLLHPLSGGDTKERPMTWDECPWQ
jgi:hypothetical protein